MLPTEFGLWTIVTKVCWVSFTFLPLSCVRSWTCFIKKTFVKKTNRAKTGQSPSLVGDTPSFMVACFFPLSSLVFVGVSLPLGCESLKTFRPKTTKTYSTTRHFHTTKNYPEKVGSKAISPSNTSVFLAPHYSGTFTSSELIKGDCSHAIPRKDFRLKSLSVCWCCFLHVSFVHEQFRFFCWQC